MRKNTNRALLSGLLACSVLALSQSLPAWGGAAVAQTETENDESKPRENPAHPNSGMELGAWSMELWGNPAATEPARVNKDRVLKIIYTGGDKDKSCVKHMTGLGVAPDGKLRCWIYAPMDKPPEISIALGTSPAYLWNESKNVALRKGWNTVELSFASPNWKTKATDWKLTNALGYPTDVRSVQIMIYNGKTSGWLYLQGLQADPDETGKKVDLLMADLLDQDFEKRAAAETALVTLGRPAIAALNLARSSERPEVMMRASFALKKIEAVQEPLPEDPMVKETMLKQRETSSFQDTRRRVEYTLQSIKSEREKIFKLSQESKEELARGRTDLANLKFATDEEKQEFLKMLDELEALSKEMLLKLEPPKVVAPEKMPAK